MRNGIMSITKTHAHSRWGLEFSNTVRARDFISSTVPPTCSMSVVVFIPVCATGSLNRVHLQR